MNKNNLKDIILDPNNKEPITLFDSKGKEITFEQVFVNEFLNQLYVILKPLDKMDGIEDDQCVVFRLIEDNDDYRLVAEDDFELAEVVYDRYMDALNNKNKKGN